MTGRAVPLSRYERATGLVFGADEGALAIPASGEDPWSALLKAVARPLARTPCVVSFSGGFDSSLILALAAAAARERGLPMPVPVTLRFPGVRSAEESRWQELVVQHLGLSDWERIELAEELDLLGEIACQGLASHGLLWPANAHFHVPIFLAAQGGTVLTGIDGDGLFGWQWARQWGVVKRRQPPRPRDALRIALALAPEPVRRARLAQSAAPWATWLRQDVVRATRRTLGREAAGEPRRWDDRVCWWARRRYLAVLVASLDLLAESHGSRITHPLLDRRFLAAVARHGAMSGYGSRRLAIRDLFPDLLPGQLLARRTKAVFDGAMWGPRARAFAASWDGSGADHDLVDVGALRRVWAEAQPPFPAAVLLQDAWLSTQGIRRSSASEAMASPAEP